MAYHSFSLIPMVGDNTLADRFTNMDRLFSRLTGEKPLSDIPAYNLVQKDKDHYELTVSVPGYAENELDISMLNNQLSITGKREDEKNETSDEENTIRWLHRGIIKNAFSLSFNLEHRIKIQSANLNKGLLTLKFIYDIPEQEKPQRITLNQKGKDDKIIEHDKS
ncbi:MAG: molecular chaperone IbpA [Candidatus Tokpelaia sp. JSC189]|nr:MAG: molecular chaperone IbpA [Candidatus Tokpelaia sp. JSC189]